METTLKEIGRIAVTAGLAWTLCLVVLRVAMEALNIQSARTRYTALWLGYVAIVPGALIATLLPMELSILPARVAGTVTSMTAAPATATAFGLVGVLSLVVLTSIVAGLARFLGSMTLVMRHHLCSTPCDDSRIEWIVAQLKHDLGIRQGVSCRVSHCVAGPCSYGMPRATILLPASFAQSADTNTLRHVIAHELVHIGQGDFGANLLQKFVRALNAWNPFAIVFDRLIDQWREESCDRTVVSMPQIDRRAYAGTLIGIADVVRRSAPSVASVALIRHHSSLKRRVKQMRITQTQDRRAATVLLSSLVAIAFVLIACSNTDVNAPDPNTAAVSENVSKDGLHTVASAEKHVVLRDKEGNQLLLEVAPDAEFGVDHLKSLMESEEHKSMFFGDPGDGSMKVIELKEGENTWFGDGTDGELHFEEKAAD